MILWFMFKNGVAEFAELNALVYRTTIWFAINMIAQSLIIFISSLVLVKRLTMESGMLSFVRSKASQIEQEWQSAAGTQPSDERPRFCRYCGSELVPDGLFCTCCGRRIE